MNWFKKLPPILRLVLGVLGMVVAPMATLLAGGFFFLNWYLDDTAFRHERIEAGQHIVHAIETFKTRTGNYPSSLSELIPQYLSVIPNLTNEPPQIGEWHYCVATNDTIVSYQLKFLLNREQCLEYEPPKWFINGEGGLTVILTNTP